MKPVQLWLPESLKTICLIVFLLFGIGGCATRAPYNYNASDYNKGQAVAQTALSQVGKPYRFGGVTPKTGFDCSGLIYWSYKQHGLEVPRVAKEQMKSGQKVDNGKLRPGDIVAFRLGKNRYHTGLYIGRGKFVHSPSKGKKVRVEEMRSDYWKNRFVGVRRVLH